MSTTGGQRIGILRENLHFEAILWNFQQIKIAYKLSIKQLASENDKINREREEFSDTVDKLRNQFETDFAKNLEKISNIETFIDNKLKKSEVG